MASCWCAPTAANPPSPPTAISNDGETLYWQALTGKTLYAIATALLRDGVSEKRRAAAVKTVASTHVADGLWMSKAGTL